MPFRFEVSDVLWAEIEPLIPVRERRHRYPGRKAIDDRLALSGILHVLHTGIAWEDLPREYGYGSGVTCWRRLRTWQRAGVGTRCISSCWSSSTPPGRSTGRVLRRTPVISVPFWGLLTGASPVDRGRVGSKHHLLVDATGIPLAITLTGGHRNDVTQLIPLLEYLHARPVAGKPGRPRRKPDIVFADRGYDHDKYRRLLWARGIASEPATNATPRSTGHSSRSPARSSATDDSTHFERPS